MVDAVMFSSETTEWETPQRLFDELDHEFGFTLDVCATAANTKVRYVEISGGSWEPSDAASKGYFTKEDDAFVQDWSTTGRRVCWMNPPYGNPEYPCKPACARKRCGERGRHVMEYVPGIRHWIIKASEESEKGATVVCLLPARTDTAWFHFYIWDRYGHQPIPRVEVRFLLGRLRFGGATNPAPFPSMIVVFYPPQEARS